MFWHFKLIWAASLMLQCRCSTQGTHQLVSLRCSQEGKAPAINCTILTEAGCVGDQYMWSDSNSSNDLCKSGDSNYQCKWDNRTFVTLVFTKEAKCGTYRVFIEMSCGIAKSNTAVTHCDNGKLFCLCLSIFVKNLH